MQKRRLISKALGWLARPVISIADITIVVCMAAAAERLLLLRTHGTLYLFALVVSLLVVFISRIIAQAQHEPE